MSRGRALGPGRLAKQGRQWVLFWTDERGRRRRKALSTNKATAERLRSELIHQRDLARAGLSTEAGQHRKLTELLREYLVDLQPRVSERHYKNVAQRLSHIVERLNGVRVAELKPMDVVRVRNEAVRGGASHRTGNLLTDRLRAMFRWAERNDLVGKSPIENLDRLPETQDHKAYRRRALSEEEIARFLAASEADDEENELRAGLEGLTRVPQTPLWLALLEVGARYGEMRTVTWGDVDLGRALLTLQAASTKSRKRRVIPLRRGLVKRLKALRVIHESVHGRLPNVSDIVFLSPEGVPHRWPTTNINRVLRRLLNRAGIPRIDAEGRRVDVHSLRHTFASRLARNGVGLFQAQKLLGHSDPKLTSAVYSHVDAEDLRPAIEALPDVAVDVPETQAKEAK